jgi:hypothetical protein
MLKGDAAFSILLTVSHFTTHIHLTALSLSATSSHPRNVLDKVSGYSLIHPLAAG